MKTEKNFDFVYASIVSTTDGYTILPAGLVPSHALCVLVPGRENGKHKLYYLNHKCRDTSKFGMLKCFLKARLTEMRVNSENNSKSANDDVQKSISTTRMNRGVMLVTANKRGHLNMSGALWCIDSVISDVIPLKKTSRIYELVVERGLGYDDSRVHDELNSYVEACLQQWGYFRELNDAWDALREKNEAARAERVKKAWNERNAEKPEYAEAV